MPRRTARAKDPVHEHLALQLTGWNVRVAAGLNSAVWETRKHHDGMPVYEFGSSVELLAVCVGPSTRRQEAYRLNVHGSERHAGEFAHKLSAFQTCTTEATDSDHFDRLRSLHVHTGNRSVRLGIPGKLPEASNTTFFVSHACGIYCTKRIHDLLARLGLVSPVT